MMDDDVTTIHNPGTGIMVGALCIIFTLVAPVPGDPAARSEPFVLLRCGTRNEEGTRQLVLDVPRAEGYMKRWDWVAPKPPLYLFFFFFFFY